MLIVVVAGFMIGLYFVFSPGALPFVLPWWGVALCVFLYVALALAGSEAGARLMLRRLMRGPPPRRGPAILTAGLQLYLLAGLAGLIILGWGRWPTRPWLGEELGLLARLLGLLAFAAGLAGYWWGIYPLERALRDRARMQMVLEGLEIPSSWSRRQFLLFHLRQHLLFVAVPAVLIVLLRGLLTGVDEWIGPGVSWVAGLAAAAGVFVFAPALVVRIWATAPLPPGTLRQRLEEVCRGVGLTYHDIRVWRTYSVIVNAGVMGIIRRARYVLLSDALLERLDEQSVAVILAHEAGHVVHHHILHLGAFTVGLLMLVTPLLDGLALALPLWSQLGELPSLAATGAAWVALFGPVSRRFEWQSDVFACWAATQTLRPGADALAPEAVALFSRALTAVGRLNGMDLDKPNFRHGSIRQRLDYLGRLSAAGLGRQHEDRKTARLKCWLWAVFAAGLVATAVTCFLPTDGR